MSSLPTGTVTFLFTDIEGSTTLLQRLGNRRYAEVLAEHQRLLRAAFERGNGREVDTQGDAFLVAFPRARDAVATAVAAQRALTKHPWPDDTLLRVRMGLHTGEPISNPNRYVGVDVHRAARICAAGHGGQILLSDAVSSLAARDLPPDVTLRDLGTHRLKDLKEREHLFQVVHPDLSRDFPPPKSLDLFPSNLPRQLTSFIGRGHEMAEVKKLLSTTCLLTLTGAGGSGKTRLAIQVAADALREYADGVWWVELAALADPRLVPQTVVSTLSLREQPGRPLIETLLEHLQPRTLLLVLDNCEHLLLACAQLADALLRGCPNLTILVTSREGLGIAGETLYPVPSLSVPEPQRVPPPEQLTRYEAVQLFTERATAILPTFKITQRNAQAVAQVCHRLDGIPLAVELAAARVKVLPVDQIASRLDDQFRLLTGGSRMALPRHQTLRAAMDWSHNLLSEPERAMLRRLSVFAGGWTLEAAEAVCTGEGVEATDALDLLTRLVDKSLAITEAHDGAGRYRLLETVRQYTRDRLLESGEAEVVRKRQRDFFLALAEDAETHSGGPNQVMWLDRLESEHGNLRAALEWSLGGGDTEPALRLAKGLSQLWSIRGYYSEGRQWLEAVVSATGGVLSSLRAWVLDAAGAMARRLGDIEHAVARFEESVAVYRALGDKKGMADALDSLGIAAYRQGNYRRAAALLEESTSLSREAGDKAVMGFSLYLLGVVARLRGDYQAAESLCTESLSLHRALGRKRHVALALDGLGLVALCRGDHERANSLCEEALALHSEEGYKYGRAASLNSLGLVACVQGDYKRAMSMCEESLALSREMGDRGAMARSLYVLGRVARHQRNVERAVAQIRESLALFRELGEKLGIIQSMEALGGVAASSAPGRAARLFAAAEGLREAIGAPLPPYDRADQDSAVGSVHTALGETTFEAAWAAGRAMMLEQAIDYALASEDPRVQSATGG